MFRGHEEKTIMKCLMDVGFDEMHISTGYLNFPREYIELFQNRNISLYASCPKENIFRSFGRFGNLIGRLYCYSFYRTVECIPSIRAHELIREDHTFHLKGKCNIFNFRILGI
jgi:CDP-diacylglycerol---glycerol-3-phosphate 3-phosphatidyltransferase